MIIFFDNYTENQTPFDEAGQGENRSSKDFVDGFTDSSTAKLALTESHSSSLAASLTSIDNSLKEYIDQKISSDDLVNPFSTDIEDSVFDAINLDDDHLRLLAKGLIGLLALLAIYIIFKK